jgi:hypothetical protein
MTMAKSVCIQSNLFMTKSAPLSTILCLSASNKNGEIANPFDPTVKQAPRCVLGRILAPTNNHEIEWGATISGNIAVPEYSTRTSSL